MKSYQKHGVVISVLSFIAGIGIFWAISFNFVVTPLRQEKEDSRVFLIEKDLRMLEALGAKQPEDALRKWQTRLTFHVKAMQGPLRHHPGADYFLWWIKEICKNSSSLETIELIRLLADVPDTKPLPPRIYWRQVEEY